MKGMIVCKRRLRDDGSWEDVPAYFLEGRPVSEEEYRAAIPENDSPGGVFLQGTHRGWPLASDAAGVHRLQVPAMIEKDRKLGVPTEYTRDGRPVFRDRGHRRAYLKAHKLIDRNSYTGY